MKLTFYFFFTIILCLFFNSAFSESNDPFLITDVKIFSEAEDLDSAKLKATSEGLSTGFSQLLTRITASNVRWRADLIEPDEVNGLIESYDTTFERKTSSSYMATIDIKFSKNAVKKRFSYLGLSYGQYFNSPTLIIPLTINNGQINYLQLNNWEKACLKAPEKFGLSNFKYLLNDLSDQTKLSKIDFKNPSFSDFTDLLNYYEASNVALLMMLEDKDQVHFKFMSLVKAIGLCGKNLTVIRAMI